MIKVRHLGAQILGVATFLVLWELLARVYWTPGAVVPPLSTILEFAAGNYALLAQAALKTLTATVLGFAAGAAFGFLAGVAFAESRLLEKMFFPIFVVSQTVPIVAFGALIIIWFGNGILSKVMIAFYLTFFPVTVNTHRGLLSVDSRAVDLLRAFGASRWVIFRKLRLPSALPWIMAALLLGASLALVGAIVGEWFGDTSGLGVMLVQAMYSEDLPRLWAVIVTSGIIGAGLYGAVLAVRRTFVWWGTEI